MFIQKSTAPEIWLERRLFKVYSDEVKACDESGQSTQHIGDEWMRREIRKLCGFDVSDRWIKTFRLKFNIRYFSGRRHAVELPTRTSAGPSSSFPKERRVLRTSRKEYDDVDWKVNEEIVKRQSKGERLTNPWIREYAQIISGQLYPNNKQVAEFFDYNWLHRFKRRYNVDLKPRSSSTTEEDIKRLSSEKPGPVTPPPKLQPILPIKSEPLENVPSSPINLTKPVTTRPLPATLPRAPPNSPSIDIKLPDNRALSSIVPLKPEPCKKSTPSPMNLTKPATAPSVPPISSSTDKPPILPIKPKPLQKLTPIKLTPTTGAPPRAPPLETSVHSPFINYKQRFSYLPPQLYQLQQCILFSSLPLPLTTSMDPTSLPAILVPVSSQPSTSSQ